MSPEAILVIGKALGWIGIPLAWACWEVWRLRPSREDESGGGQVDASEDITAHENTHDARR